MKCVMCDGNGLIGDPLPDGMGNHGEMITCPTCHGTGGKPAKKYSFKAAYQGRRREIVWWRLPDSPELGQVHATPWFSFKWDGKDWIATLPKKRKKVRLPEESEMVKKKPSVQKVKPKSRKPKLEDFTFFTGTASGKKPAKIHTPEDRWWKLPDSGKLNEIHTTPSGFSFKWNGEDWIAVPPKVKKKKPKTEDCVRCAGTGTVTERDPKRGVYDEMSCPTCLGTGVEPMVFQWKPLGTEPVQLKHVGTKTGRITVKGTVVVDGSKPTIGTLTEDQQRRYIELGRKLPSLRWWYSSHPQLGCSPKEAVDSGRFDEVEKIMPVLPVLDKKVTKKSKLKECQGRVRFWMTEARQWRKLYQDQRGGEAFAKIQQELAEARKECRRLFEQQLETSEAKKRILISADTQLDYLLSGSFLWKYSRATLRDVARRCGVKRGRYMKDVVDNLKDASTKIRVTIELLP